MSANADSGKNTLFKDFYSLAEHETHKRKDSMWPRRGQGL